MINNVIYEFYYRIIKHINSKNVHGLRCFPTWSSEGINQLYKTLKAQSCPNSVRLTIERAAV